jgi:hypothetical protein
MLSWYAAFSLFQAALSAVSVVIGVLLVALASTEMSGRGTRPLANASATAEDRQSAG